jgi:C1A family cysteine protease
MNKITKRSMSDYGWRPDLPDLRDFKFSKYIGWCHKFKLKSDVDLRPDMPPVYDQKSLGSCTSNAIAAMFQFVNNKEKGKDFMPSRLFIYYNERDTEGSVAVDNGALIRDGIKSVNVQGVCPEDMWKYDITAFATKPTQGCYDEALNHQSIQYMRVGRSLSEMMTCLMQGFPFVFGFSVYESFESDEVAKTGVVPMPKKNEKLLGGHACLAVGFSKSKQMMLARNSWTSNWGEGGYFWLPFEFFTNANLSDDFWTLRSVEI